MQKEDLQVTSGLIIKDFKLEDESLSFDSLVGLERWLQRVITQLLDRDFERLLQAMYRIDIDERKFKAVFAGEGDVAVGLANLVLERELEKVAMRKRYS